jgi:hypothetical protein
LPANINLIKAVFGLFLFLTATVCGVLEIIALLDPVGTKMADDSDPFGNPYLPWYVHAIYILFVISCFGFGFLLIRSSFRAKKSS